MTFRMIFTIAVFLSLFAGMGSEAQATPLDKWMISCGVDKGAIVKKGKTRIFRTSTNHCPGGTFNQRAEIFTDRITPRHKGAYTFRATVEMRTNSRERFDIFQIHDGRYGCAPPLKVEILSDGRISLDSEFKIGNEPGLNCRYNRPLSDQTSRARLKRDGTPHDLEITVDFDGKGGFRVWVKLDGTPQIAGVYQPPAGGAFFKSKFFFFKHGVYSKNIFPYEMISRNMRVKRVRLK